MDYTSRFIHNGCARKSWLDILALVRFLFGNVAVPVPSTKHGTLQKTSQGQSSCCDEQRDLLQILLESKRGMEEAGKR